MNIKEIIRSFGIGIRNILLGGNLISLSLLTRPKQIVVYATENLFYYKSLFNKRGIPQKNVFEVLPSNEVEEIKLANLNTKGTWFHSSPSGAKDLVSLCLICQIIKPHVIFEIGTLKGYLAYHFALNSPQAQVYTLDLPKEQSSSQTSLSTTIMDNQRIRAYLKSKSYCFKDSQVTSKITCLFGDSATFDYSDFEGKVDFFFIDGAHSYEYVRNDTLKALKCCHSGSVIAWHDFGRMGVNGVTKYILELSKKYEIYAVPGGSLAFMKVP